MIVSGSIRVPGDKSLTHRALLFASMARGRCHIGGTLTSLDARSSARVLRQLGATVAPLREGATVTITGRGRLHRPDAILDCGNSGTTTRLLLGLLAGHRFSATLTGDASLRRRPMKRVTEPLSLMGARFTGPRSRSAADHRAGWPAPAAAVRMPVSSAQIKSSLLLAGVAGGVEVAVHEPHGRSRDHTERMLRSFGYQVEEEGGWIRLAPTGAIVPFDMQVPGDPSSAVFPVAAALLAESGELRITGVGVNPTRTGFVPSSPGWAPGWRSRICEESFQEPVGDLVARPSTLAATEVAPGRFPG